MKKWWWLVCLCIPVLVQGKTLLIGMNADMKGGSAKGGEAIRRGAQFAIDDINGSGLLGQHKLKLLVKDHRGNPARGMDNVRDYADNPDVVAILGGIHTPVVLHELPLIHEKKIPYLVPWAAGTPVVSNDYQPNYVFRLSVRDQFAGEVLIKHAKQSGFKKVALLLEQTGWGRSNDKSMHTAAKKLGVQVVGVYWFNWGEKNFAHHFDDAQQKGAQAIMFVANAPEGVRATKAMAQRPQASRLPIISHWGITGGNFAENVGLMDLQKVDLRVLQTYQFEDLNSNALARDLMARYRSRFALSHNYIDAVPGFSHAYDLIHILALAISRSPSLSRQSIRNALENVPQHKGLVRTYRPPFNKDNHEALSAEDYSIARYNQQGHVVPWRQGER